jgi:hypothetical protein
VGYLSTATGNRRATASGHFVEGRARAKAAVIAIRDRGRLGKLGRAKARGAGCNATLVTIHLQIKPCAPKIRRQPLGFIDAIGISTRRKIFRKYLASARELPAT